MTIRKQHLKQQKIIRRVSPGLIILLIIAFILTGCDTIPIPEFLMSKTPTPGSVQVSTQTPSLPTDIPEETIATQSASQNKLILWVPPQFDPANSGEAGRLLQTQLDQFMTDNPGVQIDLRVKSLVGSANMLKVLEETLQTAPLAAPSIILVPQDDLQTAAQMNLIQPIPNLDDMFTDEDWYDYARQMSQVDNQGFGVPFASDAMIFLYRAESVETAPSSWSEVLGYEMPVLFPANDPKALFTINLYLSIGGSFYDEQQQLQFEQTKLRQVLGFYANGTTNGVFPTWLTQYDADQMVWQAFQQNTADFAISWASHYLNELPVDVIAIPVPSLGAESVTLVSGWLWGLSDPFPERQALSIQLMEYLVEQDFLSKWTFQSGLIPVRPSSMEAWDNQIIRSLISQITLSAQILPPNETLAQITPLLEEAAYDIIMKRATASEAASSAVDQLLNP